MRSALRRAGYDLILVDESGPQIPPDFDAAGASFHNAESGTHIALRESLQYLVQHEIPGDIVECGVSKG